MGREQVYVRTVAAAAARPCGPAYVGGCGDEDAASSKEFALPAVILAIAKVAHDEVGCSLVHNRTGVVNQSTQRDIWREGRVPRSFL